jgi:fatty-acyl-CoA synthase
VLEGLMQDYPLTLAHLLERMRTVNRDAQVVTLTEQGTVSATFAEIAARADRLAHVLRKLAVEDGARVATFAWNNQSHLELYMAVPCSGAVLHTLNIRLAARQLSYIINHAEDDLIFVDASLVELLAPLAEELQSVRHFIVTGDARQAAKAAERLPRAYCYEELLAGAPAEPFDYPRLAEQQAAALCYTSGTTGNPKGVLYSHRSISLHSMASLLRDALGMGREDRVLVVVPMFHANAWGMPHAAALCGADLILPDRFLQAEPLARLIEAQRPTIMGCVPTIFQDLLRYADSHDSDLHSLRNAACGGSAVPRALMEAFEERHGVRIFQAWGMTETSPVATYARPSEQGEHDERYWQARARQGRALPWVEVRIVDGEGGTLPWDGSSTGELEARGPWIAKRYFREESDGERFDEGWLRTGDVAAIGPDGFVQITDRAKDVIKSGGEWISSVELENELMAHPDVVEAAVIAKPDERYDERPLCCVVLRPEALARAGRG